MKVVYFAKKTGQLEAPNTCKATNIKTYSVRDECVAGGNTICNKYKVLQIKCFGR